MNISNSSFFDMQNSIGLSMVTGGTIYNNLTDSATKDGIDLQASHNILVSHNSCLNSHPSPGAHPDCVQIYSKIGSPVSSDIEVSDNLAFGNTQGFTKFSTGGIATNISILRNLVETTFPQGIACYDCYNSNISDNLLVTLAASLHRVSVNVIGGADNTVAGNVLQYPGPATPYRPAFGTLWHYAGVIPFPPDVPEPSTWLSLIAGFGLLGGAMRYRRSAATGSRQRSGPILGISPGVGR